MCIEKELGALIMFVDAKHINSPTDSLAGTALDARGLQDFLSLETQTVEIVSIMNEANAKFLEALNPSGAALH